MTTTTRSGSGSTVPGPSSEGAGFEKGNEQEQSAASGLAPCPICGEPRGDVSPCPYCGMD